MPVPVNALMSAAYSLSEPVALTSNAPPANDARQVAPALLATVQAMQIVAPTNAAQATAASPG